MTKKEAKKLLYFIDYNSVENLKREPKLYLSLESYEYYKKMIKEMYEAKNVNIKH